MNRCFPIVDDDRDEVDPAKEAEDQRQQSWDIFVASLRDCAHAYGWCQVFEALVDAHNVLGEDLTPTAADIYDFADLYGWPDTLRAIAQAMQADEVQKRELDARR